MPLLKNLMQASALNIRKAYKHSASSLPRIASFIGTSNREDLLVDRTGSRRFLCVSLKHAIDCTTSVEHKQLYAQLKTELLSVNEAGSIKKRNRLYSNIMPYSTSMYPKKRCSAFAFALLQKRTIRRKCLASPPPSCLNV